MRILISLAIGIIAQNSIAKPIVKNKKFYLHNVQQNTTTHFLVEISNPDTVPYTIKPQHDCGCTEFYNKKYVLPAKGFLAFTVGYNSSGNMGHINRKFFIQYLSSKKDIDTINFEATVDSFPNPINFTKKNPFAFSVDKLTHNFGNIKEGPYAQTTFKITNHSDSIFFITNVQSSCGCCVAHWSRDPLKKGDTAEIITTMNTQSRSGYFTKSFVVTLSTGNQFILTITGNILIDEEEKE